LLDTDQKKMRHEQPEILTAQPVCSWDHPGVNPYRGRSGDAIDRYTDIPAAVRSTLRRRIEEQQPDDMVTITRDGISGKSQYDPAIRDMHFGAASVCATVTRSKWAENHQEPAAVYCVDKHCILVPKICGNVSRISRLPVAAMAKNGGQRPPAAPADRAARQLGDKLDSKDLGLADAAPRDMPSDRRSHIISTTARREPTLSARRLRFYRLPC
jgi:hypothetical protein